MLDTVKSHIKTLIALYEAEKAQNNQLQKSLEVCRQENETYRKQIDELKQKIDSLKLTDVLLGTSRNGAQAKKRIDDLISEIDRCIRLLEE